MSLHGFDRFKDTQEPQDVVYFFKVSPLYCQNCVDRISKVFESNGIAAICQANRFGTKGGNEKGDLQVCVNENVTKDELAKILTTKAGRKIFNDRSDEKKIRFGV